MGVISIRLNKGDENILEFLTDYYDQDKSSLIKQILIEKYEDLQDLTTINNFEKSEENEKTSFNKFEEIIKNI